MQAKDNLYLAVNQQELDAITIPADKPMYGSFMKIDEAVEKRLLEDLALMAKGEMLITNSYQHQMIQYYRLATDFETREKEAWNPFRPVIDKYLQLISFADLQNFARENLLAYLPFSMHIGADMKDTQINTVYLDDPGCFLPDKTYYTDNHPNGKILLEVLRKQVYCLLLDYGYLETEANTLLDDAFAYDFKIQQFTKDSVEKSDYASSYNPRDIDVCEQYSNYFSFKKYLVDLLNKDVTTVIVSNPSYFKHLNEILNPDNFQQLKAWMIVNEFLQVGNYLSEHIRELSSQYTKTITGNEEISKKEKHSFQLVCESFSSVIGDYYGKKYFGEEAKKDIQHIVKRIIDTYRNRLSRNTWLSKETIQKAILKLDKIETLLGYPDDIKEIHKKIIVDTNISFYQNKRVITELFVRNNLNKYQTEVNRKEWEMSANTVNAYYHPFNNLICFPAAILQAPFYSYTQSKSKNYGGIGAVIAHEISHAFDNNGAKFDEFGNLNNWWKEDDFKAFELKAEDMIELWNNFEVNGTKVNGKLTVSENIADLGGLSCALEALQSEEDFNLQEFFENWARIWCLKIRPEFEQLLLQIDVHAPTSLRANITPRHLDEFYSCFAVTSKDGMYLAPEKRITIW